MHRAGTTSNLARPAPTRITLVEDHTLFAEALDLALSLRGHEVRRVAVEGETMSQDRLLGAILRSRPRVVLLDLDLGRSTSSMGLIRPVTAAGIAVVVVTGSVDRARWGESLYHGARTVISKTAGLNAILASIRHIERGQRLLPIEERQLLLASFHDHRRREHDGLARLATLTPREHEILGELTRGRQVCQIAQDSVVSESTVRTQVKSILAKLGVSSQLGAVGVALGSHRHEPVGSEHYG